MAHFIQASWISFQIKKNCKSLGISRGRFFYVLTGGKTCARDVNTLCENRLWRCTLGLISSPFLLVHRAWHSSTQSQEVLCSTCSEQHKAFLFLKSHWCAVVPPAGGRSHPDTSPPPASSEGHFCPSLVCIIYLNQCLFSIVVLVKENNA